MLLDDDNHHKAIECFFHLDHCDSHHSSYDHSIAQIFEDNWERFLLDPEIQCLPLRSSIIKNVEKMIQCAKRELGYDLFQCPQCLNTSFVYHTCKSRFVHLVVLNI